MLAVAGAVFAIGITQENGSTQIPGTRSYAREIWRWTV